MSNYTIHLSRQEGCCIASIPELCITGEAANPEDALANVMLAEAEVLEKLKAARVTLPPASGRITPLPKVHALLMKAAWFFGKVAAAFVIFLLLSTAIVAMIYPIFDERARAYILSPASKENTQKIIKYLGISVCREAKVRSDYP